MGKKSGKLKKIRVKKYIYVNKYGKYEMEYRTDGPTQIQKCPNVMKNERKKHVNEM